MAKPVFIIRYPATTPREWCDRSTEEVKDKMKDYHVLGIRDSSIKEVSFETFNVKDAKDKTLTQMKNLVNKILKEKEF